VTRFRPGDAVVLHELWEGRVWGARPMRVVRDDERLVALWFPRGTRWRAPIDDPSREWDGDRGDRLAACAASGRWTHRELVWDVDTLQLVRAGDWHAVWVSWLTSGEPYGWYVNLQRPLTRTPAGFATMDLMLDVVVNPDRIWHWKDEDELEAFVRSGAFEPDLPQRLREEGLRVAARAERGEPPFDASSHEWRPDPGWQLPELPADWVQAWR
jgi:hypothetical protein